MVQYFKLRSVVINKTGYVYADDVYDALNINKHKALEILDSADIIVDKGIELISDWMLMALDLQIKEKNLYREFVFI
ncbi:hypothetical protein SOASR030_02810 [Leminorella grimontii]|uniref:Uncharacterized protein n=1 Tax=Leminorella grimontii TaxID=82981 RepID=A0AAV5MZ20_9GAMM|nr:hypothetical protein GLGR_1813 [Leminorella grimontii ATCC 33999 = DSM 5078]GKX54169.1 hypothetical protein SOASR030_02810 [Leminorella grimontii]GKX60590.1 hypothetical protein SOASR031_29050 [Leminorella grimontii]VFS59866.1 Uncharacterised protein [Leminorella grimontii]